MKNSIRVSAVVVLCAPFLFASLSQPQDNATDVWTPLRAFVGTWEGTGEGQGGVSHGRQEFRFILDGRYLQVQNFTRFDPQEKNPKGQTHQDWGFFSYDKGRKAFVLRQFHVEGFVNQYLGDISNDGRTLVFTSESIENLPPGFRARLSYRFLGPDEFEQTFDLASPGKEFECYSRGTLKRTAR